MIEKNVPIASIGEQSIKTEHTTLMAELTKLHSPILSLLEGRNVHYLDMPVYGNIGDLLIMLGTLQFFSKHGINCSVQAGFFNYNITEATPKDVLVFQGGGNLGDLYIGPQQLREDAAKNARHSRIVILPQTIHFRSEKALNQCREVFGGHPDLHIFVRDRHSYEIARSMSSNVYLAPDMAHQLWNCKDFKGTGPNGKGGHLGLIRTDGESTVPQVSGITHRTDWPVVVGPTRAFLIRSIYQTVRLMHRVGINGPFRKIQMEVWVWYARKLAQEAVALLNNVSTITTDRLHGHILACLLEVPHTLIDNDYGKNSSYANAWTIKSELVSLSMEQPS